MLGIRVGLPDKYNNLLRLGVSVRFDVLSGEPEWTSPRPLGGRLPICSAAADHRRADRTIQAARWRRHLGMEC